MKILILKPSSLGDVVQALPVLRALRHHWPAAEVYWWIDADLEELLAEDPDLAGVIPFPRRRWRAARHWPEVVGSIRTLRRFAWDYVVDLQALARSAIAAWLAHGRVTVGLEDYREAAPAFYDVRVPRASFHTHAVDWYLAVLGALGVPAVWTQEWLPLRPASAASVRKRWEVGQGDWIALQPGARWSNKRWPVEAFAATVQALVRLRPAARFVVLGGVGDRALGEALVAAAPGRCVDVTGQTSLSEMVEWIRLSRLLITNDTGPMHVAAALGRPVVALFGPTEPRRTGPYGQLGHVLQRRLSCVPCLRDTCGFMRPLACLREIAPAEVVAAVQARLGADPSA